MHREKRESQEQRVTNVEIAELRQTLQHLLVEATQQGRISQREAFVVGARMAIADGTWQTLRDIAQALAVRRERVRQIQNRALWKLCQQTAFAAAFHTYLKRISPPKARHQKPPWLH
ncbi:MAG: hypothetical protein J2P37_28965 [Ktedonobacteraceae bacterium]|nr:hypothetical protein [Ktedonobacteraceae bacterium]